MSKVSLQKQTRELLSVAEDINKTISSAQLRVKNQVVWLQDAEKAQKEKMRQQRLLEKQHEDEIMAKKAAEQEEKRKLEAEQAAKQKEAQEEARKAEEKKTRAEKEKKTAQQKKASTPKPTAKAEKSVIEKKPTAKAEKPVIDEKTKPKAKKETNSKDKVVHKTSVVPVKKGSSSDGDNKKQKSKVTIVNIDDRPKRKIGIRVVKAAPTPEEIKAKKKEEQERRQRVKKQAEEKRQSRNSSSNTREKAQPKNNYSPQNNKQRNNSTPDFSSGTQNVSTVKQESRRKSKSSKSSSYHEMQNTSTRKKSKKSRVEEAKRKKYVFDGVYSPTGSRKRGSRKSAPKKQIEKKVIEHAVVTTPTVSIKDLAEKIGKPGAEIIKQLFVLGVIANINQSIDFDTAALVSSELGVTLEQKLEKTNEEKMVAAHDGLNEDDKNLVKRAPIVTVMGHVDHGKTSLLDAIRNANVIEGEAGGITQHIGAYTIKYNGEDITFIDTPGHEAFTAMRARGAQVTDIAILVVAADDGVMPQTVEAINHSKAADVPIIVAINKMDVPGANPERVKQELTEHNLVTEEWGGDTIMVPVSALKNENIDSLLENILLVAEVQELKANPSTTAKGTIVEAQLDIGRGPVATVLIQNGTLKVGDSIVAGTISGRVRAMLDDKGNRLEEAGPSTPVEVLGFNEVPQASDIMYVADDKLSRKVAADRRTQIREDQVKSSQMVTLDDLFNKINEGKLKDLNIVLKADVQGSAEAVKQSLMKLSNDEVRVNIKHSGVGAISETDVNLAAVSNAIIIGFNVRPDANGAKAAENENVEIRTYRIIYKAIEDVENAIKGMLQPIYEEVVQGHAEVRNVIRISSVGNIAGSYVTDGVFTRSSQARVLRDGVIIYEGVLSSLKRFKDDVREVRQGFECGIGIENFNDIKEGDVIEAFTMKEVER
jgi:translation initiation factor IF-2